MGRRSKKSNDVDTPEKPGNVGAKRESKNETERSAKKQKLAAAASTNHGMNSTTASIPEKKLPTAASLDENSTSISKKEDDIDNNEVGKSGRVHTDEDVINDHNEAGKCGQVHVDEPTRDCTAPGESGKPDNEPHKMSKKRSKKNSKKLSKKKLKKESAQANQSSNKEDEASANKNHGSKIVFVANLSSLISKDQIMKFFKDAGEIVDVRIPKQFRGFCHVEFVDEATAQRALKKNGVKLMGCDIVISNEGSCNRGKLDVFVKGLDMSQPSEETRKSLREYFHSCGEIAYVLTPAKRNGISKGYAFLGFKDEVALSKALELNNTKLGDFILTVKEGGRRDGSGDGGVHADFGSGGGGGGSSALDGGSDVDGGGNSGFGGCPGCDSIFCHGGSFGGSSGNGFNRGNGFRGENGFSGGKSGEFGSGSQVRGGGVNHSVGVQGCGGGRSHSGGDQGRRGGRSHSGGRFQAGGQGHGDGRSYNGGLALNDNRGHGGGQSHSGGRGRGGGNGRGGSRGRY